ncbi:MAG: ATP phosphoribosyltransferase regulatory subunit [Eubacteriales bacterium]|nr:ATP phosphoribosyltransferase regulatory subunit [Eubacteriales bacterium]
MKKDLLHTPEGVRDIYSRECAEKKVLESRLHDVCKLYGYNDIQTPSIEFFDVFNKERGSVPSNEMFKLFDRYGNTLVLRPDMTPSIARAAAKYFEDHILPIKLCYVSNTFVNVSKYYQGRLKENTIIGAELIDDDSIDADFEIISMVIDCMKNSGLKEFQVELGNVGFFNGLLDEAGIAGDDYEELLSYLNEKNYIGVEEFLNSLNIDKKIAKVLLELPQLFGSVDVLEKAKSLTSNKESLSAVNRLLHLYELLKIKGYDKYVSFDLGELSNHRYYTGLIFHAFTFGTGEPVVSGGRYDKLLGQFGCDKASIGFSITIDRLMAAISRQNIEIPVDYNGTLIVYTPEKHVEAVKEAEKLRNQGINVCMIRNNENKISEQYEEYAANSQLSDVIYIK